MQNAKMIVNLDIEAFLKGGGMILTGPDLATFICMEGAEKYFEQMYELMYEKRIGRTEESNTDFEAAIVKVIDEELKRILALLSMLKMSKLGGIGCFMIAPREHGMSMCLSALTALSVHLQWTSNMQDCFMRQYYFYDSKGGRLSAHRSLYQD